MKQESIIQKKSFEFALEIIQLYKLLIENKEFIVSKQLLRSGTSIGANVEEASAAASKKDFINKMIIASKEARETKYWLRLLSESKLVNTDYADDLNKADELINILASIIKTSQANELAAKILSNS